MAIYLFLMAAGVGVVLARDGQPRTDSYNGKDAVIAMIVHLGLLYMAGAFHQ